MVGPRPVLHFEHDSLPFLIISYMLHDPDHCQGGTLDWSVKDSATGRMPIHEASLNNNSYLVQSALESAGKASAGKRHIILNILLVLAFHIGTTFFLPATCKQHVSNSEDFS